MRIRSFPEGPLAANGIEAELAVMLLGGMGSTTMAQPDPNWIEHDRTRPLPVVIAPATPSTQETAGKAPSDATILFDGKVIGKNVPVRDDGSFSIDIPVTHAPGEMVVTVEQRDGQRLTTEKATLDITTRDHPD